MHYDKCHDNIIEAYDYCMIIYNYSDCIHYSCVSALFLCNPTMQACHVTVLSSIQEVALE